MNISGSSQNGISLVNTTGTQSLTDLVIEARVARFADEIPEQSVGAHVRREGKSEQNDANDRGAEFYGAAHSINGSKRQARRDR